MEVVTTTLEMTAPDQLRAGRSLPPGARIELVEQPTPELLRWLYAVVGGPWTWTDRLAWPRERWATEIAEPGSEVWLLTTRGAPAGYVQLGATDEGGSSHVEVRYFGLVEWAIGHGLGGPLLADGLRQAWTLAERHPVPPVSRVWVHTCSLDGPAAIGNYEARGLRVVDRVTTTEEVPPEPLGAWVSAGGPPVGARSADQRT
ncbi:GNAT family N-acetyltransferase [Nocardioides sp.]|uniref:GNAT family N-acetyltransferase n=1 Tax=Nocardioides sp. TaxID=35761 RepID=UPI0027346C40|nr:GNAT family N-acetyltransferase [Nocardioides sp.]MDP3891872.1 GNAT family N-acetyltransferase [Nocardioides sp.]